ncbi:hypothetical protein SAMN04489860_0465 [Paraoerskovia marina]|uniref:Uncharacterized protein n=1 Tax=Paraoerskovia marina TaxID=545619 RepID=A0A1H1N8I4_9CELL|nr:hypothetical protein [Paraoerskovia marina]SDR95247.1 hypothetical protein SAMN04489860_0465 [Paraoerskovia marina]
MVEKYYLRIDGILEHEPGARRRERARRTGVTLIEHGMLCTACMVGSWGRTELSRNRTLCNVCHHFAHHLATAAATSPADRQTILHRLIGPSVRDDSGVAAARAHLKARVHGVFDEAVLQGVPIVERPTRSGPTTPAIGVRDLRRSGLVSDAMEQRVQRYADWLEALEPTDHAVHAEALSAVAGLGAMLRRWDSDQELKNARRRFRESLKRLSAASRSVGADLIGLVQAHRLRFR